MNAPRFLATTAYNACAIVSMIYAHATTKSHIYLLFVLRYDNNHFILYYSMNRKKLFMHCSPNSSFPALFERRLTSTLDKNIVPNYFAAPHFNALKQKPHSERRPHLMTRLHSQRRLIYECWRRHISRGTALSYP